jgi:hypothetical protein
VPLPAQNPVSAALLRRERSISHDVMVAAHVEETRRRTTEASIVAYYVWGTFRSKSPFTY